MADDQTNINSDIFKLGINDRVKSMFLSMAKWTKFLAILGFIIMGILIVFFSIRSLSNQSETLETSLAVKLGSITGAVIVVFAIFFYPNYAMLNYSNKIKRAFVSDNQEQFELGIKFLNNSLRYLSILLAVCLLVNCVTFVVVFFDIIKFFKN